MRLNTLRTRRQRRKDETGAEIVEFSLIFCIVIALLYGIVYFGATFATKVSVTQAAADGSRAGIAYQTTLTADQTAANQADGDLGWLGFSSVVCNSVSTTGAALSTSGNVAYACMGPCTGTISSCTTPCTAASGGRCTGGCTITNAVLCPVASAASTVALMIVSYEASCTSVSTNTCLTTNVTYYDRNQTLVPAPPGLGLLSPSNIASTSTSEVSTPTP